MWCVTIYFHARLIDIRWYKDEKKAREYYAESLVKYSCEYNITIAKQ